MNEDLRLPWYIDGGGGAIRNAQDELILDCPVLSGDESLTLISAVVQTMNQSILRGDCSSE